MVISRQADADWQAILSTREGNPPTFRADDREQVLEAYRNASGKMTLGAIGIAGGAGMTAAGAGLLLWELLGAPKAPQSASKVACVPAAGAIHCALTFP